MKPIVHQTQPTPYSCCQTCVAMLLGVPAKRIIALSGHDAGMSHMDLLAFLDRLGLRFDALAFGRLLFEGFYLVTVPSLVYPGKGHKVLLHLTSRGNLKVYDPNKGYPGRKYYVHGRQPKTGWEEPLAYWSEVIYLLPPPKLEL